MRLQRPQARSGPAGGEHDLADLRRGPLRPLALQRERQLQRLGRRARRDHPRPGNERFEPAPAVVADPAVKRPARDSDQPAVRADMLTLAQRADQPAALRFRQAGIGGVADQRVPEQPDLPATVFIHAVSQRSRSRARDRLSSPHRREGGVRVAQQHAARQHARDPPRITRTEPQHPRPRSDRDRLQRIRDRRRRPAAPPRAPDRARPPTA